MSQFWNFFNLGLGQVLNIQAIEHILFLIVVVAIFSYSDWIRLLWLITIFTLGHLLAIALSMYNVVTVSGNLIYFLIPVTILLTALFSLFTAGKNRRDGRIQIFYFISLFLGIMYGLNFASRFQAATTASSGEFLPLLEYGLGFEAGQLIVVLVAMLLSFVIQTIFRFSRRDWVMVISAIVIGYMISLLMRDGILSLG